MRILYWHLVTDRNKEGKAEGKRFNQIQIVAKWLNRSAFGWGILYWMHLASKVPGA